MSRDTEEWRPVLGWESLYEVSDHGRVRSQPRTVVRRNRGPLVYTGKVLKPFSHPHSGHLKVRLSERQTGRMPTCSVHVLVLEAFVGPRPKGLHACHRDDDPTNNLLGNLRWGSRADNADDSVANGRHGQAAKTHCPRGHEYSPENTYVYRGSRACRACNRAKARDYAARKKAGESIPAPGPRARCRRGHVFTPENTITWARGRTCRICRDASQAAHRERQRATRTSQ